MTEEVMAMKIVQADDIDQLLIKLDDFLYHGYLLKRIL